jgi:hypothetical protein
MATSRMIFFNSSVFLNTRSRYVRFHNLPAASGIATEAAAIVVVTSDAAAAVATLADAAVTAVAEAATVAASRNAARNVFMWAPSCLPRTRSVSVDGRNE